MFSLERISLHLNFFLNLNFDAIKLFNILLVLAVSLNTFLHGALFIRYLLWLVNLEFLDVLYEN